jgi:Bcr/CflA subfamily drug resistance transporter
MTKPVIPLFLLILLVGFPQLSETIYSPALPSMVSDLSTTPFWVEMSLSVYFVGFALGMGTWGYLADLWGRRPCMLIGLVVYGLSCALLASASSIQAVLFLRTVQAFGASAGSIITQTMARDTLDGEDRHRAFSIISMAIAFTPALGPLWGGFLCSAFSWRATFTFLLALAALLFCICLWRLEETRPAALKRPEARPSFIGTGRRMLCDFYVLGHVILVAGCNGTTFGFFAEGPFLSRHVLLMSAQEYSLFGILVSAGILFSASLSYRLQGRKEPAEIVGYGVKTVFLGAAILLTFLLSGTITAGNTVGLCGLVAGLGTSFFGLGLIIPNSLSVALRNYAEVMGTAGAVFGLFYYIGIAGMLGLVGTMHNGTASPLPLFFTIQAIILSIGYGLTRFFEPAKQRTAIIDTMSEK